MIEASIVKRIEQITSLFDQICIEHPIRIEINKINQPTQLIIFAWILAICRKGYESFGEIDFKDHALNGMAERMRIKLIDILQNSGELTGLTAKYFDEPDIATGYSYKKKLSYKLPPKIMTKLVCEDPALTMLQVQTSPKQENRSTYRKDAVGNAIINRILPKILPNPSIEFIKSMEWKCFLLLEKALIEDGAKNIEMDKQSNKDESTVSGTDCHEDEIFTTYKAFKERLKNLLQIYKLSF